MQQQAYIQENNILLLLKKTGHKMPKGYGTLNENEQGIETSVEHFHSTKRSRYAELIQNISRFYENKTFKIKSFFVTLERAKMYDG